MKKRSLKLMYFRVQWLLIVALYTFDPCQGQTINYLSANKTGNILQTGSLLSLGTGNAGLTSPMNEHRTGILNTLRFYYGSNVLNTTSSSPTTITASRRLNTLNILSDAADAYIQFRNTGNSNISSGNTTYFKISQPAITGLGVSVGGLLGLSEVYNIYGRGYSGAGNYVLGGSYNENTGSPAGTVAGTRTELLIDKNGTWYAAITPDATYNSVRLNIAFDNSINLLNVGRDLAVDVYAAFYYTFPGGVDCGKPIFTTAGEVEGVNLNLGSTTQLLALDTALVNPQNAIDDDTTTYSRITSGALGIADAISQTILFNDKGNSTDAVTIKLSLPLSALTAAVLSRIYITAYNGSSQVGNSQSMYSLIDIDLLGLLGNNTPFYIYMRPGGQFNRVSIMLDDLVNVGSSILGGGIRIYNISRVNNPPLITAQPQNDTVCSSSIAEISVSASGDSLSYSWEYYDNNTWVSAGSNTPQLIIPQANTNINGRRYRVSITGGTCSESQATFISDEAVLRVKALPDPPSVYISQ